MKDINTSPLPVRWVHYCPILQESKQKLLRSACRAGIHSYPILCSLTCGSQRTVSH